MIGASRRRGVPACAALALLLAVPAGGLAQQPPTDPAPGRLVDVGGHRLHIHCVGPTGAGPTVVLEAGAGEFSTAWSAVQERLSDRVRTCAYDRAGWGWSEGGPGPRTPTQEAFELRALLDSAEVPDPYVLVGHSYGGLLVRRYIQRYGEEVVGAVLVEPTHESGRQGVVGEGWVRLRERAGDRPVPEPRRLQPGEAPTTGYDPWRDHWPEELRRMHESRTEEPEPLGDRPLVVVAGTRPRPPPPGTSDSLWSELREERRTQDADLARLSRDGRLVRDPSSGHHVHLDDPELVARVIERVIEEVEENGTDGD